MKSSLSLSISDDARRDIRSILRYTLKTWGDRQRNIYAERLTAALQELSQFPALGRSRNHIVPGLRSYPIGEHVIYYRVDPGGVHRVARASPEDGRKHDAWRLTLLQHRCPPERRRVRTRSAQIACAPNQERRRPDRPSRLFDPA